MTWPLLTFTVWHSEEADSTTLKQGDEPPCYIDGSPTEPDNVAVDIITAFDWDVAIDEYRTNLEAGKYRTRNGRVQ